MLFKLLDFDRFFARRVAPVAIAVVLTAIASLWMDLSITYISTQNSLFWILAVAGLYTVGLSSVLLLLCLINIKPKKKSLLYGVSVIGCCFFTFHTMFLDGLLWTIFFHK